MKSWISFGRVLLVAAAVSALGALTGCRPAPSTPFYPGAGAGAVAQIVASLREAAGDPTHALAIEISPYRVAMQVQDRANPRHIDEYVYERSRGRRSIFYWDVLSGPAPVTPVIIDKNLEANLFFLGDIDYQRLDALIEDALRVAALEDPARVSHIEIRRVISLLPAAKAGEVRISLSVTSGRESAMVFATAKGEIAGLDLHDTNRARTLDLFSDATKIGAGLSALKDALGGEPRVTALTVEVQKIEVRTDIPEASALPMIGGPVPATAAFQWNLEGVKRTQNLIPLSLGGLESSIPFRVGELDVSTLRKLIETAPAALKMSEGAVTEVKVTRPGDRPGVPQLIFEVQVQESNGTRGQLFASHTGEITRLISPHSPTNYFAAGAFAQVLTEIAAAFGEDVKLIQISVERGAISATVSDPKNGGRPVVYTLRDEGFQRDGLLSGLVTDFRPFSLADLRGLTPDHVAQLTSQALETLKVPAGVLSSITIGRNSLYPSPKGNISIEFRSNDPSTFKIGLINYELDGTVIKVEMP